MVGIGAIAYYSSETISYAFLYKAFKILWAPTKVFTD
jgi:hypothetical protein